MFVSPESTPHKAGFDGGITPMGRMDTDRLIEVAPHYVAMLLLVFVVLAIVRLIVGELGFWAEFVVIAVVIFGYRPVVQWLGIGPSAWEQ